MMSVNDRLGKMLTKAGLNKPTMIFVAGLAGILLIAFAGFPERRAVQASTAPTENAPTTTSYEQKLEERLETILESIEGVGRVDVMVTLESGYGYEYAKENKMGSDKLEDIGREDSQKTQEKSTAEESYVMVDGKNGEKSPLITKELEPRVKGVVIVCDGGNSPTVMTQVIDTVRVAVNILSTQISVSPMVKNVGIK